MADQADEGHSDVDRCFGFGEEFRCLLTEPQSPATIAPNFFMNFSFDNTVVE